MAYIDFKKLNEERFQAMRKVNLAAFLCDKFGYHVKSRHPKEIILDGGVAGQLNIFRDRDHPEEWRYKCWYDSRGGHIVNYLCNYEGYGNPRDAGTMQRIFEETSAYQPSEFALSHSVSQDYSVKRPKPADLSCLPLESFRYLTTRGIDESLLTHPKYVGAVLNKLHHDSKLNADFLNIALPVRDSYGEICAVEMKNKGLGQGEDSRNFSGFVKGGAVGEGLWMSNDPVTTDYFCIGEAAIDLMSYNALHPERLNDTKDFSIAGRISPLQIPHLQQRIDAYKPKGLILINDLDTAGISYDLAMVAGLRAPGDKEPRIDTMMHVIKNSAGHSVNHVRAAFEINSNKTGLRQDDAVNKLMQLFQRLDGLTVGGDRVFTLTPVMYNDKFGYGRFEATFHNNLNHDRRLLKIFLDLYNNNNFFSIQKPAGLQLSGAQITDWNEKLMQHKGLQKSAILGNFNPYSGKNSERDLSSNSHDSIRGKEKGSGLGK